MDGSHQCQSNRIEFSLGGSSCDQKLSCLNYFYLLPDSVPNQIARHGGLLLSIHDAVSPTLGGLACHSVAHRLPRGGGVRTSPQVCSRREGDKERRPRVSHQVREANEDGDGRHSSSSHDVPEILRASIHALTGVQSSRYPGPLLPPMEF